MIKNFSIFKVTEKKTDKSPDYTLSIKTDNGFEEIGGGWIKEGQNGKYISVKLSDERSWDYEGKTITRNGFHIEMDKKEPPVLEYPEETINPDDNPF
jgi:uncharacterized protein (DUF736 family)